MTDQQALQQGFTHRGQMYGFDGYLCLNDDEHETFKAKWWLTDVIVECIIYLDMLVGFNEYGFKFKVKYEL